MKLLMSHAKTPSVTLAANIHSYSPLALPPQTPRTVRPATRPHVYLISFLRIDFIDTSPKNLTDWTLMGHAKHMSRIAYTPDGRYLISISGGEIRVWDVHTGLNYALTT
ncbi:hypothetical protein BV22DRAFT_898897 [Leucogyrophana mollusca]|uniref:Uncharacterized protein n=1 Tax=Leucogyrophana mollusca TaxID=85980 RepID=A0ACB8AZA0_9AGAM|nr:hypothetical protein BV22DRAFT_898897 [Leucogyrophana mollusca]